MRAPLRQASSKPEEVEQEKRSAGEGSFGERRRSLVQRLYAVLARVVVEVYYAPCGPRLRRAL